MCLLCFKKNIQFADIGKVSLLTKKNGAKAFPSEIGLCAGNPLKQGCCLLGDGPLKLNYGGGSGFREKHLLVLAGIVKKLVDRMIFIFSLRKEY